MRPPLARHVCVRGAAWHARRAAACSAAASQDGAAEPAAHAVCDWAQTGARVDRALQRGAAGHDGGVGLCGRADDDARAARQPPLWHAAAPRLLTVWAPAVCASTTGVWGLPARHAPPARFLPPWYAAASGHAPASRSLPPRDASPSGCLPPRHASSSRCLPPRHATAPGHDGDGPAAAGHAPSSGHVPTRDAASRDVPSGHASAARFPRRRLLEDGELPHIYRYRIMILTK